jgi:hypothetical protein
MKAPDTPTSSQPLTGTNGLVSTVWYTWFQYLGRAIPNISAALMSALNSPSLSAAFTALASQGGTIGSPLTLAAPLSVPNGGTGAANLQPHGFLVGAGAASVKTLQPGAVGSLPVSNGTDWQTNAPPLVTIYGGTEVTAAGTAGNVLTSNGTKWVSAPPVGYTQPTAYGAIGTYAASNTSSGAVTAGSTYSGSSIGLPAGTWQCMGVLVQYPPGALALYLRLS